MSIGIKRNIKCYMIAVQTLFLAAFFASNVVLNLTLIPLLGLHGSAIATACAIVLQVFYLKALASKTVQIRI